MVNQSPTANNGKQNEVPHAADNPPQTLSATELLRQAVAKQSAEIVAPFFATTEFQPLPIDHNLAMQGSQWLNDYVAFSRHWSPRSYEGYHEAMGLWVLSTVAARRVVGYLGGANYTNLSIIIAGVSSLNAKTTAAKVATGLLERAGADYLMTPDKSTPQSFIKGLVADWDKSDDLDDFGEKRLAFQGQRGWFYEEFGGGLNAMLRQDGVMADFRGILREFDDCPKRYESMTISRGSEMIFNPYLAMMGNCTPADLRKVANKGNALWGDGFLARWGFVCPEMGAPIKRDKFPLGEMTFPNNLLTTLYDWHSRLGIPEIDKQAKKVYPTITKMTITSEVEGLFYDYNNKLLDIIEGGLHSDLQPIYARFHSKALRIAILLASLDGLTVEARHWWRACQIAENWRMGLHNLYSQVNAAEADKAKELEDKIYEMIQKRGRVTAREAGQYCNKSAKEVSATLEAMFNSGLIDGIKDGKTLRYIIPIISIPTNNNNSNNNNHDNNHDSTEEGSVVV